jgi:hypothetical protein
LPSDFTARPVVPATGAVTVVHARFSSAWRSAAWAIALVEVASSYSFWLIAFDSISPCSRFISRPA